MRGEITLEGAEERRATREAEATTARARPEFEIAAIAGLEDEGKADVETWRVERHAAIAERRAENTLRAEPLRRQLAALEAESASLDTEDADIDAEAQEMRRVFDPAYDRFLADVTRSEDAKVRWAVEQGADEFALMQLPPHLRERASQERRRLEDIGARRVFG